MAIFIVCLACSVDMPVCILATLSGLLRPGKNVEMDRSDVPLKPCLHITNWNGFPRFFYYRFICYIAVLSKSLHSPMTPLPIQTRSTGSTRLRGVIRGTRYRACWPDPASLSLSWSTSSILLRGGQRDSIQGPLAGPRLTLPALTFPG